MLVVLKQRERVWNKWNPAPPVKSGLWSEKEEEEDDEEEEEQGEKIFCSIQLHFYSSAK